MSKPWLPGEPVVPVYAIRNFGEPFVRNSPSPFGAKDKPPNSGGGGGGKGGAALGAPTNLAATPNGSTQVDLTWTDNASAEGGYKIERSLTGTSGWAQVGTAAANAVSASDTGLVAVTQYFYRVRAYSGSRNGAYSNVDDATTGAAATSPGTTGLAGWWALEEDSNATREDSHTTNIDLPCATTASRAAGKIGFALSVSAAVPQWLTYTATAALQLGSADQSFSVAVWVNAATLSAAVKDIVTLSHNTAAASRVWELRYDNTAGRFQFRVTNDGTSWTAVNADLLGAPSTGTWYLLVAYHDGAGDQIGISVNGGAFDTAAHAAGVRATVGAFTVGAGRGGTNPFDGLADQLAYYKGVALTQPNAAWFYNSGNARAYADL